MSTQTQNFQTSGCAIFYRARAAITRRLIEKHRFSIVAVEADWPDAARIDRYVRHHAHEPSSEEAFSRFPTWMWRNIEVHDFVEWLRARARRPCANAARSWSAASRMFSSAAACAARGCAAGKTSTNDTHNLGILMRALFGAGTPKEAAAIRNTFLFVIQTAEAITVMIVAVFDADGAALIIAVASAVA